MIDPNFLEAEAKKHDVSENEMEVLTLAVEGHSTNAIAQKIGINPDAVRQRLSKVYQKFQVKGVGPVKLKNLIQTLMSRYQENYQNSTVADSHKPICEIKNNYPTEDIWQMPDASIFYGRTEELAELEGWVVKDNARIICLYGLPGIGKSSLAAKLVERVKDDFEYVIWRSLDNKPKLGELLKDLLKFLYHPQTQKSDFSGNADEIFDLITFLREHRCLLILDDVENILKSDDLYGRFHEDYEKEYSKLIENIGKFQHKSCLLLNSNELLRDIRKLSSSTQVVYSSKIDNLKPEKAKEIFYEKGLTGENAWDSIVQYCGGNPALLNISAEMIVDVFNKNVDEYIKFATKSSIPYISDYENILKLAIQPLSDNEKQVLLNCFVDAKEPISFNDIKECVQNKILKETIQSLINRSLIERVKIVDKGTEKFLFKLLPIVRRHLQKYPLL